MNAIVDFAMRFVEDDKTQFDPGGWNINNMDSLRHYKYKSYSELVKEIVKQIEDKYHSSVYRAINKEFNLDINESVINEGVLAKQGVSKLSDYSLVGAHDSDMKEFDEKLAKLLGEKDYKKIIQVDSEYDGDNPLQSKIFDYLESNFRGSGVPGMMDYVQDFNYDKKLNVAKIDDYGFVGYLFTDKSKF